MVVAHTEVNHVWIGIASGSSACGDVSTLLLELRVGKEFCPDGLPLLSAPSAATEKCARRSALESMPAVALRQALASIGSPAVNRRCLLPPGRAPWFCFLALPLASLLGPLRL